MRQIRGFTLIELLATIAILAIVMAMAVPSFDRVMVRARIDSDVSRVRDAVTYARGEAVNRQVSVSICSSTNATTTATCSGSSDWTDGWIVFLDVDGNGARDPDLNAGEDLLKVWQDGISGDGSLNETSGAQSSSTTFARDGALARSAQSIELTLMPSNTCRPGELRVISISNIGRVSVEEGGCP